MLQPDTLHKMDMLFFRSIVKNRKANLVATFYHLIKGLICIIFLPIDVISLETQSTLMILYLALGIAVSLFNCFTYFLLTVIAYGNNRNNNLYFLSMAEIGHMTKDNLESGDIDDLEKCVSHQMYNQEQETLVDDEGLTEEIKNVYENTMGNLISTAVMQKHGFLALFESLGRFTSFSMIIFGIVALCLSNPAASSEEIGIIVVYMILQAIFNWKIVAIFLIIGLSPLLITIACIFCCCCRNNMNQGMMSVPEQVPATMPMIVEAGGTCSICMQEFKVEQPVIQLKCSPKHMFHDSCLRRWLEFGRTTCPICRQTIS